jgi:putative zinc finger/helix-turn-helix YgiT family protein
MKELERKPYHYTESGLDNVYLYGVAEYKCPKCGNEMVQIPRIAQLHIILAIVISQKPERLTGEEIRFMRKEVGMNGKAFAEAIGITPVSLSRWENNKEKHSDSHDKLVRYIFRSMMQKRMQDMMDYIEESISQAEVISYQNRRMDVKTDQMRFFKIHERAVCDCANA